MRSCASIGVKSPQLETKKLSKDRFPGGKSFDRSNEPGWRREGNARFGLFICAFRRRVLIVASDSQKKGNFRRLAIHALRRSVTSC